MILRGTAVLVTLAALCAPALAQRAPEGRWRAEERCPGQPPRSFVLTSDGTMLTARLASDAGGGLSSILGFAPLLPGGRFALDIAAGGADAKSSYTGRLRPDRTGSADGGAWSGSSFTPCQLQISWLGGPAGEAPGSARSGKPEPAPPVTAGRPETIPSPRSGPTTAGRPEPIAPAVPPPSAASRQPAAPATLPPCEDDGPPPSSLGADGVWRPSCVPRSLRAAPAPGPAPVPAPARTAPAVPAAPPATAGETEALRRQLEAERARAEEASRRAAEAERQADEDRRRAEAAERAMQLNESLGRQGRN